MKIRYALILAITALLLAACNFTLAADVTPPPGYVPPTPAPTLGPLFPANAPDLQNGAAIFAQKCAPCHGTTGLGDGPDGKQLPVTVAALGLPEVARKATPAQWFMTVTQGNIDRFMPPFTSSLSEQDRWDVVAYALTLHSTPEQIAAGKALFDANCANCADQFKDQEKMASLSPTELVNLIRKGDANIPPFGSNLSDEQAYAVAAYLRTLTFAAPVAQAATSTSLSAGPTTVPVTQVAVSPESGTPSAEVTPAKGTPQAEVTAEATEGTSPGFGIVSGSASSNASVPEGLPVTLHGYDHVDQTSGPQEVLTLNGAIDANGAYQFENVEMPEGRIFLAEVEYQGIQFQSDFLPVASGQTELVLPPVTLYESSTDLSLLELQQVHLYSDFANEDFVQFLEIYTLVNNSEKAVNISTDGTNIPFISPPEGATDVGYERGQDSAPLTSSADGVAILPSETPYSIIAFFSLPYTDKSLEIKQKFVLDTPSLLLLIPEGIKVKGEQLTPGDLQTIQNGTFQTFDASALKAGDTLTFTVSGKPKTSGSTANLLQNKNLLIIAGGIGLLLIVAGAWMYMRDRNRVDEALDEEDDEFEDRESILDAIIALDDLHRAGKLSDEAYRKRREELKAKLKE